MAHSYVFDVSFLAIVCSLRCWIVVWTSTSTANQPTEAGECRHCLSPWSKQSRQIHQQTAVRLIVRIFVVKFVLLKARHILRQLFPQVNARHLLMDLTVNSRFILSRVSRIALRSAVLTRLDKFKASRTRWCSNNKVVFG